MRYLLDKEGLLLAKIESSPEDETEGIEIDVELPDYTNIQRVRWSGTKWTVEDDDDLKAEQDALTATEYSRNRSFAYPNIGDQLDDLYKKGAFSDEMAAKLKKVKDDNPKPE